VKEYVVGVANPDIVPLNIPVDVNVVFAGIELPACNEYAIVESEFAVKAILNAKLSICSANPDAVIQLGLPLVNTPDTLNATLLSGLIM
jgi:hypothetical protein